MQGELLKLGIDVCQATVTKSLARQHKPASQTWCTFLRHPVEPWVGRDFLVVPTVSFGRLFVFGVLAHHRRRGMHFHGTAHPSSEWLAQAMAEAFPGDAAPRDLLHDRDSS